MSTKPDLAATLHEIILEWDDLEGAETNDILDSYSAAFNRDEVSGFQYHVAFVRRSASITNLACLIAGIVPIVEGPLPLPAKIAAAVFLISTGVDVKKISNIEGDLLDLIGYKTSTPELNAEKIHQLVLTCPELTHALANLEQRGLIYDNKRGNIFINESLMVKFKI